MSWFVRRALDKNLPEKFDQINKMLILSRYNVDMLGVLKDACWKIIIISEVVIMFNSQVQNQGHIQERPNDERDGEYLDQATFSGAMAGVLLPAIITIGIGLSGVPVSDVVFYTTIPGGGLLGGVAGFLYATWYINNNSRDEASDIERDSATQPEGGPLYQHPRM